MLGISDKTVCRGSASPLLHPFLPSLESRGTISRFKLAPNGRLPTCSTSGCPELPLGPKWLYEPKFDGYRGLLVNNSHGKTSIRSRNDKDLGRWFPELVALVGRLPRAAVLDGEIVTPTEKGVSFIALQRRLASRTRESPVVLADLIGSGH